MPVNKSVLIISNYDKSLITDLDKYYITRSGTNKPEERQELLINELQKYFIIKKADNKLKVDDIIKLKVHSQAYMNFLENCYKSWQGQNDEQYIYFNGSGIMPLTQSFNRNIEHYEKVIKNLVPYRQLGYFIDDSMSPIYQNTFDVAIQSADAAFSVQTHITNYDYIYVSGTYPGHHAKFNSGGGYCFINNSALCAFSLKNIGYKVCILDLDYHHGNGTQDICFDSSILSVSIHANPEFDFPIYEGYETENTDMNVNIIFPPKATYNDYKVVLNKALNKIKDFNADVIVVAFGFDTYKKDPDASKNYGCCLEINDYKQIGIEIKKLKKKVCVIQEGGYYLEDGPSIVYNLLSGLSEN
jgi:acetoin utilization deacetylase AcuC-like enzyme